MDYNTVREYFDYDERGFLKWRKIPGTKNGNVNIGQKAGSVNADGYIIIVLGRKYYKAHRLVYLWHHGYMPENWIDHINRNRVDNRIDNLREVSPTCSVINRGIQSNNKTGIVGISWRKDRRQYYVSITRNKKRCALGSYNDFDEAVLARLAAEQWIGWHKCDMDSSAYRYAIEKGLIKC